MTNNKTQSIPVIVDLATISEIENTPIDLVRRDSLLNSMQRLLEHNDIIFIEGIHGVGKTTLLLDFVWQNSSNSISHFATQNYTFTRSYDCVIDNIFRQIYYYCYNEELNPDARVDLSLFNSISDKLFRKIRKAKKPLYFIFDGFESLEKNQIESLIPIFDNLPWGKAQFIFTGLREHLCLLYGLRNVKTKDFVISNFEIAETREYFKEFCIDDIKIQEIHRLSDKGHPETLKELKLLCIESGGVDNFLNSDLDIQKIDFLEMFWNKVDQNDNVQIQILSLLAFNDVQLDIKTFSHILKHDEDVLKTKIKTLSFIEFVNDKIRFQSETIRKFIRNKLKNFENEINLLLIEYYEENLVDDDSLFNLPNLYKKAKQWEKLTKFYSIDAFKHIMMKYQSLSSINQHFVQGFDASKMNNNNKFDEAYLRFALHKSTVIELEKHELWESEIEARIALGDYEQSILLANSAFLKEDRIKLLAILAKEIKVKDLYEHKDKEKDLIDQIQNLYEQIDFSSIQEKGFEIASLLIYSCYDLAIDLVEKISNNTASENSLDYAFAYLTLHAVEENKKNKAQVIDTDFINDKIQNNDVKNITKALSFLSCEFNVEQIIQNVEKFNFHQKIFLIKNWIVNNRDVVGVEKAIKFALEEIVKSSTENVPNATTLSEIASPLPNLKDYSEIENLILLFDAHKNTIDRPTKDYIKLQLIIAEALNVFNKEKSRDRIFDIYFIIDDLTDLSIKTDCLCLLWLWLIKNDTQKHIETSISTSETIEYQVKRNVECLLDSTAYHFKMIEFIIITIVAENTDFIFDIITKINTQERKDVAFKLAASNYVQKKSIKELDLKVVSRFFSKIIDTTKKEKIIIEVIDKFFFEKKNVIGYCDRLLPYFNSIFEITRIENKCYAIAHAIKILNFEYELYKNEISQLLQELNNSWENIDSQWNKIEIGFHIARDLVDFSLDEANRFLKLASDIKQQELFSSDQIAMTYINSAKLSVRAFSGLTLIKNDLDEELNKLAEVIKKVNSVGEKLKLWSELAQRIYAYKKTDLFNKIYKEYINPLLSIRNSLDTACQIETITIIAPVIYLNSQNIFITDYLNKLPIIFQNIAISNVCDFILTKISCEDPLEENQNLKELEYSELNDVCLLLEKVSEDLVIYHFVEILVKALSGHNNLSVDQKDSIKFKIKTIIDKQLPTVAGIQHEGYKIISEASLLSLEEYKNKSQSWNSLVQRAEQIPNLSDKALILIILAEKINAKSNKEKIELMDKSFNLIQTIPSMYDKTNRLDSSWETWLDIDKGKFTKYLKLAYQDLLKSKDDEMNGIRNLIDAAQQYDTKLADTFVTMLDQDEARKKLKLPLLKRIDSNNKITKGSTDYNTLYDLNSFQFGKVFKKNLRELNSGKMVTREVRDTYDIIEKSSTLSLKDALEAYQYFIQNACKRYETNKKDSDIIKSIFNATIENTKPISILSMDNTNKVKIIHDLDLNDYSKKNVIFQSGDREKAIAFIRNWIDENTDEKMFIIDPYFTEEDLTILKIIQEINPSCQVTILTSKAGSKNCHNDSNDIEKSINKEFYKQSWRKLSSESPVDTTIKIVWDKNTNKCPFHDRWIVVGEAKAGLALGASFNGLGNRDTQITALNEEELQGVMNLIIIYIYKSEKRINNFNLKYEQFDLED